MLQYGTASVLGSYSADPRLFCLVSEEANATASLAKATHYLSKVQATFDLSLQEPLNIFASGTHGSHISGTSCESSEK